MSEVKVSRFRKLWRRWWEEYPPPGPLSEEDKVIFAEELAANKAKAKELVERERAREEADRAHFIDCLARAGEDWCIHCRYFYAGEASSLFDHVVWGKPCQAYPPDSRGRGTTSWSETCVVFKSINEE